MVMGRDSRSKGHGFDSQHHLLDGHFFTYICCKNCSVCLNRPNIKRKRGWGWPIFLKKVIGEQFRWKIRNMLGCRHSSVDSSAPSILLPRVQVPSTPSMLFSIYIIQIVYLSFELECKKNENKQKEAGIYFSIFGHLCR